MLRAFRAVTRTLRRRPTDPCTGHHWHIGPRGRHWTCCRCPGRSSTRKPPPVNDTGCALHTGAAADELVDWVVGLRVDT